MAPFSKVLVANRGEIAIRIFRTLRELGIAPVAVYSEADRDALHVRAADEAYLIGPGPAAESYLVGERILDAARQAGAEAIHPGYGFLAENAAFARAVEASGVTWIGPPSEAIELMGSKTRARTAMREAGVPIIPGATDPVETVEEVLRLGEEVGYPLIVKAAAGGGGKGMKLVGAPEEAERAFESAQREGEKYFADSRVYVERYLEDPRHVEVQVLADAHGNVIHLGERDCTIQRRHQKLIEETPSPAVDDALRERIGRIAVDAARAAGYRSAGHDRRAADRGRRLLLHGDEHADPGRAHRHRGGDRGSTSCASRCSSPRASRCRSGRRTCSCAATRSSAGSTPRTSPTASCPRPGRITAYREPSGPGVRVDSGVVAGSEITGLYDPMIAKLIVHGVDREHARMRMLRALDEFELGGPPTLLGFHRALLSHPCFVAGETCHGIVESEEIAVRAGELTREPPQAEPSRERARPRRARRRSRSAGAATT